MVNIKIYKHNLVVKEIVDTYDWVDILYKSKLIQPDIVKYSRACDIYYFNEKDARIEVWLNS